MWRLRAIGIALAATTLAAPRIARAEPDTEGSARSAGEVKAQCVSAFDRGQRAQSDRALRRAQADLIICSQESCPNVLRADCAGVLAEVRSALPTVVFAADDGSGHELTDVKVYAGSELLARSLDGRAIPIDPGTFELRFERDGHEPVALSRTIREGEKSRVIRVSLAAGRGAEGDTDAPGKRSTLGWVVPGSLVAVGLAGLGVALYTRLHFDSRVDDLRSSCAPECTQRQRDDLSSTVVTSNVALGAGIGLLAGSVVAWVLFTPPSGSARASSATIGRWTW